MAADGRPRGEFRGGTSKEHGETVILMVHWDTSELLNRASQRCSRSQKVIPVFPPADVGANWMTDAAWDSFSAQRRPSVGQNHNRLHGLLQEPKALLPIAHPVIITDGLSLSSAFPPPIWRNIPFPPVKMKIDLIFFPDASQIKKHKHTTIVLSRQKP